MGDRVSITVDGHIADVRLNRPDKMNAVDPAMFEAIGEAQAEVRRTPGVRAVVLSGEGRAFCVGIDLQALASAPPVQSLTERTHGEANLFQVISWGWRTLPVPVIAAVHGFALGAGFQIMLGADIRIAAPDAQLSLMEVRWGLVPDCGGVALLKTLIRDDVARELAYTGRRLDGAEAERLGLVTRLDDNPRDNALALAREIAANSPDAVRGAKRLFNLAADASQPEILLAEAREQEAMMRTASHRETLAAAFEKRAAVFVDPPAEA